MHVWYVVAQPDVLCYLTDGLRERRPHRTTPVHNCLRRFYRLWERRALLRTDRVTISVDVGVFSKVVLRFRRSIASLRIACLS